MLPFVIMAGVGGGIVIVLTDISLSSDIGVGGDRPLVSIKALSTGQLQTAEGDTGTPLSYNNTAGEYLSKIFTGFGADYEAKLTLSSTTGSAGTLTGTVGSFVSLSTGQTWTWEKDTSVGGTATWNGTLEIRHATDTSYTKTVNVTLVAKCSP